jgi:Flp pilus assembly pilin Flp
MKSKLTSIALPCNFFLMRNYLSKYFQNKIKDFRANEFGASTVEYIFIAGTMFAVSTAALLRVETKISDLAQALFSLQAF